MNIKLRRIRRVGRDNMDPGTIEEKQKEQSDKDDQRKIKRSGRKIERIQIKPAQITIETRDHQNCAGIRQEEQELLTHAIACE